MNFAAQARAPGEQAGSGTRGPEQGLRQRRAHCHVRESRSQTQARRKLTPPLFGIPPRDQCLCFHARCAHRHGLHGAFDAEQFARQQPRRLQRHAHAFANDRMGFTGRIAYAKHAVRFTQAYARCNRACRHPSAVACRTTQRFAHTRAGIAQQSLNCVACTQRRPACAKRVEHITSQTTGHRGHALTRDHHAAVAAFECQHRQQTRGQRGPSKVGLEGKQVTWQMRATSTRTRRWQRFPRSVRRDGHRRVQSEFARAQTRPNFDGPGTSRSAYLAHSAGLEHMHACRARLRQQQGVQGFAAQGPAPGVVLLFGRRQRSAHALRATHQHHLTQRCAGLFCAHAQRLKQRPVAGGNAFTANFATRENHFLHHSHCPASAR